MRRAFLACLALLLASCASQERVGVSNPSLVNAVANAPAMAAEAVTLTGIAGADWTPTIAPQTRMLWVGGTGVVKVDLLNGGTGVTFTGVPTGSLLQVVATKVYNSADGTTATAITALY